MTILPDIGGVFITNGSHQFYIAKHGKKMNRYEVLEQEGDIELSYISDKTLAQMEPYIQYGLDAGNTIIEFDPERHGYRPTTFQDFVNKYRNVLELPGFSLIDREHRIDVVINVDQFLNNY